jgi:hypothetical protein
MLQEDAKASPRLYVSTAPLGSNKFQSSREYQKFCV